MNVFTETGASLKRMTACLAYFSRWILVTVLVFAAIQQCESFIFVKIPPRIVRVVQGNNVALVWEFSSTASKYSVIFSRQRLGEAVEEQIAKRSESSSFSYVKDSYKRDYVALLPASLRLKDVKRDEEYMYIISIVDERDVLQLSDNVTVKVVVPPQITKSSVRKPQLIIGRNFTLICNASGDPHPNITWTKDGVPVDQFNASGHFLHLVNVQREDAGSYRCTASNGYGEDANSVSIVGIRCQFGVHTCTIVIVGIKINSVLWKDAFSNHESVEFKTLESQLLSAIWSVYTKNPDKKLFRADIYNFREGSVFAAVELLFESSASQPLEPLETVTSHGKLGQFFVDRTLVFRQTTMASSPSVSSTAATTVETQEPRDKNATSTAATYTSGTATGTRVSTGLTNSEVWGIIGGCIVFVLLITSIVLIYRVYKVRKNSEGVFKGFGLQIKHQPFECDK